MAIASSVSLTGLTEGKIAPSPQAEALSGVKNSQPKVSLENLVQLGTKVWEVFTELQQMPVLPEDATFEELEALKTKQVAVIQDKLAELDIPEEWSQYITPEAITKLLSSLEGMKDQFGEIKESLQTSQEEGEPQLGVTELFEQIVSQFTTEESEDVPEDVAQLQADLRKKFNGFGANFKWDTIVSKYKEIFLLVGKLCLLKYQEIKDSLGNDSSVEKITEAVKAELEPFGFFTESDGQFACPPAIAYVMTGLVENEIEFALGEEFFWTLLGVVGKFARVGKMAKASKKMQKNKSLIVQKATELGIDSAQLEQAESLLGTFENVVKQLEIVVTRLVKVWYVLNEKNPSEVKNPRAKKSDKKSTNGHKPEANGFGH